MPPTDPVLYRLYEVRISWTDRYILSQQELQGVLVYGHAIKVSLSQTCDHTAIVMTPSYKAVVHEKVRLFFASLMEAHKPREQFGDGIMSMIDCNVHVDKRPDPKGDRVVLTFECVFMPRYC